MDVSDFYPFSVTLNSLPCRLVFSVGLIYLFNCYIYFTIYLLFHANHPCLNPSFCQILVVYRKTICQFTIVYIQLRVVLYFIRCFVSLGVKQMYRLDLLTRANYNLENQRQKLRKQSSEPGLKKPGTRVQLFTYYYSEIT